jgi:hypothetical protein
MLNRELFEHDPITTTLPNSGVAKVLEPKTDEEWDVLRFELSSFVSSGQYGAGLERILASFLARLGEAEQDAVWVSGFYGSGKSHLVRVLEYLWRDITFPDGAGARSLVHLPDEIKAQFVELTSAGKREGGLWSAAGTLGAGAGSSVRLALLGIILASAGLPTQYHIAQLVIYLKTLGTYEALAQAVADEGKDLTFELNNMLVSPVLARALAEVIPDLPNNVSEVRQLLKAQYPPREDISDDEMLGLMHHVLELQSEKPGRLPCTLIIFDELQQYIGEDPNRTLNVQMVVEKCCSQFGSKLLFVATGQSALQATSQLQKLQGRFRIPVELSDKDVQEVVREVVLLKKPTAVPALKSILERASGEIDRQLGGTRIGAKQSDAPDLVPDYPLLPVRRRFWERVLRVVDTAGGSGQLRTQLRMVHDTTRAVADRPVGSVIPADVMYDQLETTMRQNGLLLREVQERIAAQDDGTADGLLRRRLCALVFLVSQLPPSGPLATGVQSTPAMLADLLVDDLTVGGDALRARVPELLATLAREGILMEVDDQYRLQTRESAEWQADYRTRYSTTRNDAAKVAGERTARLRAAVGTALGSVKVTQGDTRTPRNYELHFGPDSPSAQSGKVPVWVRDGWSVPEGTVKAEAQHAGDESPIVFVFLPRHESDALQDAIAGATAAQNVLDTRPQPTTPEGNEAQTAMSSRRSNEEQQVSRLVAAVLAGARVFGGGGNGIYEDSLAECVQTGVNNALQRLFPQFAIADSAGWARVLTRAGNGDPNSLGAIGWNGDPADQPVCRAILGFLGGATRTGAEVRGLFTDPPYGWPRDAVDGALLALLNADQIRAFRNGRPLSPTEIVQSQIGVIEFQAEDVHVDAKTRLAIRGFITTSGTNIKPTPGEENAAVRDFLAHLADLGRIAGGDPPLPVRPSLVVVEDLQSSVGNRQLLAFFDAMGDLTTLLADWRSRADLIGRREGPWGTLHGFLPYARDLPDARDYTDSARAVEDQRALLDDPDPVPPLLVRLTAALRSALQGSRDDLEAAVRDACARLNDMEQWTQLTLEQRSDVIRASGLEPPETLEISTDGALLHTLQRASLADWANRIQAVQAKLNVAREHVIRLVTPRAIRITPPSATLNSAADVDEYLATLRHDIMPHIDAGNPVVI